jgi:hypothetical protein
MNHGNTASYTFKYNAGTQWSAEFAGIAGTMPPPGLPQQGRRKRELTKRYWLYILIKVFHNNLVKIKVHYVSGTKASPIGGG